MQIGSLARQVGKSVATLRYYEQIGLLDPPRRTETGYRQYSAAALERVRFIIHAQEHGFSLREIRDVLRLSDSGASPCVHVAEVARRKVKRIEEQIKQLERRRSILMQALASWDGDSLDETPFCPILNTADSKIEEVKNHGKNH